MKHYNNLRAWVSNRGVTTFDVPEGQSVGFVISDGCSVRFVDGDVQFVLASGRGLLELNHRHPAGRLHIVPDHKDGFVSVYMTDWGISRMPVGFKKDASFAQLEPKAPNEIPKEIRDLVERSQKQAMKRESLLRAEIERLQFGRSS